MIPTKDPLTKIPLRVRIAHDDSPVCPMEDWGRQWKLYSFGRRHVHYKDPEALGLGDLNEAGLPKVRNPGLRSKLRAGLAFFLSYYEHGRSQWSLLDTGPQCRFDSVRLAGLLVWEHPPDDMGAKTREKRAANAKQFLDTYNAWANGDVYGYDIEDPEGIVSDSCWGYFGNDTEYMLECIQQAAGGRPVFFTGGSAWIGDAYKGETADSPDIDKDD